MKAGVAELTVKRLLKREELIARERERERESLFMSSHVHTYLYLNAAEAE
jgi:hypothetical protein